MNRIIKLALLNLFLLACTGYLLAETCGIKGSIHKVTTNGVQDTHIRIKKTEVNGEIIREIDEISNEEAEQWCNSVS